MSISQGIEVNEDGSGVITTSIFLDMDAAVSLEEMFGETNTDRQQICDEFLSDETAAPESDRVTVEEFDDPDNCGIAVTIAWGVDETLQQVLEELEAEDPEAGSMFAGVFLEPNDAGGWDFMLDDAGGEITADIDGQTSGLDSFLTDMLLEGFTYSFSVTLPGEITEHNGDADGNTVKWDIDITSQGPQMIFASSQKGGGGMGLGFVALGVLGVLIFIAGVGGLIITQRKSVSSGQPLVSAETQSWGGPGASGSWGPGGPRPDWAQRARALQYMSILIYSIIGFLVGLAARRIVVILQGRRGWAVLIEVMIYALMASVALMNMALLLVLGAIVATHIEGRRQTRAAVRRIEARHGIRS